MRVEGETANLELGENKNTHLLSVRHDSSLNKHPNISHIYRSSTFHHLYYIIYCDIFIVI